MAQKDILFMKYIHGGRMQVAKWGNSLAVRLPVSLVKALNIADGDDLELRPVPASPGQPATVLVEKQASNLEKLEAARRFRSAWPADFHFDRDEANSR
jgi:antitoxin MazE